MFGILSAGFNKMKLDESYIRQQDVSSLWLGTYSLPESVLTYLLIFRYTLGLNFSVISIKIQYFHSWKSNWKCGVQMLVISTWSQWVNIGQHFLRLRLLNLFDNRINKGSVFFFILRYSVYYYFTSNGTPACGINSCIMYDNGDVHDVFTISITFLNSYQWCSWICIRNRSWDLL